MSTRENCAAGGRTRGAIPDGVHPRVFHWVVELPAEGGAEIRVIARRIRDQVIAPVIERPAMRVREAIGNVRLEFPGTRLEAENAAVKISHRTGNRFDL